MADHAALSAAVQRAIRLAVQDHKAVGNPVAAWQNQKVVLVPADEIVLIDPDMENVT